MVSSLPSSTMSNIFFALVLLAFIIKASVFAQSIAINPHPTSGDPYQNYGMHRTFYFNSSISFYEFSCNWESMYAIVCGASGWMGPNGEVPGYGGCIHTILPCERYYIFVGGASQGRIGGYNGGGSGYSGGGGGGASDVRTVVDSYTSRVAVGGGGGGGMHCGNGGNGGGLTGATYPGCFCDWNGCNSGHGGTQLSGGYGCGHYGSLGVGGDYSASGCFGNPGGGGGGGGYYGGGGSCYGGGGGGSSYSNGTIIENNQGDNNGNGIVIIYSPGICLTVPHTTEKNGACWCNVGYYSATGIGPCERCPSGSFNTRLGSSTCSCEVNFYSGSGSFRGIDDDGNINGVLPCKPCPTGSFTFGSSSVTCICAQGYVNIDGSNTLPCTSCPPNSNTYALRDPWHLVWTVLHGGGQCFCDPGYYSTTGRASSSLTAQESCVACSEGSQSPAGLTQYPYECFDWSCVQVQLDWNGRYSSINQQPGQSYCICKKGWVSSNGLQPCTRCPIGTTTGGIQTNLGSGFDQSCNVCDVGFFAGLGVPQGPTSCIPCPDGFTNNSPGQIGCPLTAPCSAGTFSPTGLYPCLACPSGQTSTADLTGCVTVTLLPTLAPNAILPPPTTRPIRTRKPSYESTVQPSTPSECGVGFYSNVGGKEPCIPCDVGSTTTETGSTTCNCVAGYYGRDGLAPCFPCEAGYYSVDGASFCTICKGFFPCFSNSSFCEPGTYGADGVSPCYPCPEGYASEFGAAYCTPCVGFAPMCTSVNKSVSSFLCPSGFFSNGATCVPCNAGTYNSLTGIEGSQSCTRCAPGTYSMAGASVCSQCLPGTYSGPGLSACIGSPCSPGTYGYPGASSNAAASCYSCPAGSFSVSYGGEITSCTTEKCPIGSYCAGDGLITLCPAGRFRALVGGVSIADCHACAVGETSKNGSSVCSCLNTCVDSPSWLPSFPLSNIPSDIPTANPTTTPSEDPTSIPTKDPSMSPSLKPTIAPSAFIPSLKPTIAPSTFNPSLKTPTIVPSTFSPSLKPTKAPSPSPTIRPSVRPTTTPSTKSPTAGPSKCPTVSPTRCPTRSPSRSPS